MVVALSLRQTVKWILRNTIASRESITPELALRLITHACPMWMSSPEQCPLPDPYWAFYWPGGQALTRYVLDNKNIFANSHVLDFGAGCGASSIAAINGGVAHVYLNDIDISAILASRLNFKLNRIEQSKVTFSNLNLLLPENEAIWSAFAARRKTFVLLGDMFYDTDFAVVVFRWLSRMKQQHHDVTILVGDPGRHPLADEEYAAQIDTPFEKILLIEYALPGYVTKEHYGFTSGKVYRIELT